MRKKNFLFTFLLLFSAVAVNAQPQSMPQAMMVDYSNPDSLATVITNEMSLNGELGEKFKTLYVSYLNEYKKLDELLPVSFGIEPGQFPTQEQIQQIQETMQKRQDITSAMEKIYDQKFLDLLGKEGHSQLKAIEKAKAKARMKELRKRFSRNRGGGFPGGGGFPDGGGFPGGGFPGGGFPGGGFPGGGM